MAGKTTYDLALARNEIYARKGRKFDDVFIQGYFNSQYWYQGLYTPQEFDALNNSLFNDYEYQNILTITEYEARQNNENSQTVPKVTLWNKQKEAELRAFMVSWGNIMGQEYEEYTPERNSGFYGADILEIVLNRSMVPAIDNHEIDICWSPDGESGSGYKIVAVYSKVVSVNDDQNYCYLFTIYNGEPIVLVTAQRQGGLPGNTIEFSETENQALKDGYSDIVNDIEVNSIVSEQEEKDYPTMYKGILDKYRTAIIEEWDQTKILEEGLNYLVARTSWGSEKAAGYAFIDIDGNGVKIPGFIAKRVKRVIIFPYLKMKPVS